MSPVRRSWVLRILAKSETYFTWLAIPSGGSPSLTFSSAVSGRSSKSSRGSTLDWRKRRSVRHHRRAIPRDDPVARLHSRRLRGARRLLHHQPLGHVELDTERLDIGRAVE